MVQPEVYLPPGVVGLPSEQDRAFIRLYARYLVSPGEPNAAKKVRLSPIITPITNLDDLLTDLKLQAATVAGVSSGALTLATVPDGKRWRLYNYNVERYNGDRTVNDVRVGDGANTLSIAGGVTAGPTVYSGMLGQPVHMDQKWIFTVNITGGATDGNWTVRLLYTEEDAF